MPESHIPSQESKASRFIRESGQVYDPEHKLWAPARWVVQMVQYLIALIILSMPKQTPSRLFYLLIMLSSSNDFPHLFHTKKEKKKENISLIINHSFLQPSRKVSRLLSPGRVLRIVLGDKQQHNMLEASSFDYSLSTYLSCLLLFLPSFGLREGHSRIMLERQMQAYFEEDKLQ